jgi:long-chain acyl-CoA synthetase
LKQAETRPHATAYAVYTGGGWQKFNWDTYASNVKQAARALMALGVNSGDPICIMSFNCPEWVIADVGAMMIGAVPAGIYQTCSAPEVEYILNHSEAPVVFLEHADHWGKVAEVRGNLPNLKHVVMLPGADAIEDDQVMTWDEFVAKGDEVAEEDALAKMNALTDESLATMIYTSGTTGPPKAVMLSHHNLSWTASCAIDIAGLVPTDSSVSYLPLAHIAEQMFTIHAPISAGSQIYFAESIEKLKDNLCDVQPTVIFGVPRVWEKFYSAVSTKLKSTKGAKAKIVAWARGVGTRVTDLRNQGREPSGLLAVQYKLANKLLFKKLKPQLGLGNARVCVSGAAPIASEVLEFFASLDVIIHEVYGQSEDCGPTTFNAPGKTRFGTVGPRVDGVEVKIAEDDEVLVRGPNVFQGYYKNQEATDETIVNGWLHSGDLGKFDGDGFLKIIGRKKDIIITAGGKNITPANIESTLKNHPLIAEAVVIGDRRKYLSALITLDEAEAARVGNGGDNLHEDQSIISQVEEGVEQTNQNFARVEHIRKFTVLSRNFNEESGELTPTSKIKRRVINENYSDEIEAMYADA